MRQEFDRVGVEFERIAAVDGAALPPSVVEDFRQNRAATKPDGWLPGEIGCFLSHFEAWRRIAAHDAPWGAVFEDDIRVSPDLTSLLASADWIPPDADIVRLEAYRSMRLAGGRPIADAAGPEALSRAVGNVWCRRLSDRGARGSVVDGDAAGASHKRRRVPVQAESLSGREEAPPLSGCARSMHPGRRARRSRRPPRKPDQEPAPRAGAVIASARIRF